MKFKLVEKLDKIFLDKISILYRESSEYWKLRDDIENEYEKEYPFPDNFYYHRKFVNTSSGIVCRVTTWLTPDDKNYDATILGDKPLKYVYRAVSIEEMNYILKEGYIKSNSSMNIGYEVTSNLTCYEKDFPGWYLPDAGGYILKITADKSMFIDTDEYIKTSKSISINNIVEVNGIKV